MILKVAVFLGFSSSKPRASGDDPGRAILTINIGK